MKEMLHLAGPSDLARVEPMVAAYHLDEGIETTAEARAAALTPLLEGSPHGAIWLIGPKIGPVGYIAISFGWSIELGGMEGFVDEFWIREGVRGRGMGGEVLRLVTANLSDAGVVALHLEVAQDNDRARLLYRRSGFRSRDKYHLMTWTARG